MQRNIEKEGKMKTNEKIRKFYVKPRVTQIKLEIQEAVLAGCKVVAAGPGPGTGFQCTRTSSKCLTTLGS